MNNNPGKNDFLKTVSARLNSWTQDRQQEIENSSRSVMKDQVNNISTSEASLSSEEKLSLAMDKIHSTALVKMNEMKDAKIDDESIRQSILAPIQRMESPFGEDSPLKKKFNEMHEKLYNEIDSKIIGEDKVLHRNINSNTSTMKV